MELPPEIYLEICKYLQRPKFEFEYKLNWGNIECKLKYIGIFGDIYFYDFTCNISDDIMINLDNYIEKLETKEKFSVKSYNYNMKFGNKYIKLYKGKYQQMKLPRDMFNSDFKNMFLEIRNVRKEIMEKIEKINKLMISCNF